MIVKRLLLIVVFFILAACNGAPVQADTPTPTITVETAVTAKPAASPTPDALATQGAARLKMTVQAYQTQTAAEKATERAGGSRPEPITPDNVETLSVSAELSLGAAIFGTRISPDSRYAVALTGENTTIIDLVQAQTVSKIAGDVFQSVVFDPTGDGFAAADDNELILRAFVANEALRFEAHTGRINSLTYTPDGGYLVTTSDDATIIVWDSATGERLKIIEIETSFGSLLPAGMVRFSPDGKNAAVFFNNDSTLWLGSAKSLLDGVPGGILVPWIDHAGPVATVEISPDWQYLAWISRGTLQLMTAAGAPIGETHQHEDWIMHTAFLPENNAFLISSMSFRGGSETGLVIAYNLTTGARLYELAAPGTIYNFVLSPERTRLLTGHSDGAIRLWDLELGKEVGVIETGVGQIQALAFSPDGRTAASLDSNGLLLIWNAETSRLLRELPLDETGFLNLAFNEDGSYLVLVAESGSILFFGIQKK